MAQIRIYSDEDNRYYNVYFNLQYAILRDPYADITGALDYYLDVYTDMLKSDGTTIGHYQIKSLSDVPPLYPSATDFGELCRDYVEYFMTLAELAMSSSSSSSTSSSSTSSSLSSSSVGYSSSSSNSSSSSSKSTSSSSSHH